MDIYNLLVYKVKRSICITVNKSFFKIIGCPFWGAGRWKGTWGGVKNVLFIGDVLHGCSSHTSKNADNQ